MNKEEKRIKESEIYNVWTSRDDLMCNYDNLEIDNINGLCMSLELSNNTGGDYHKDDDNHNHKIDGRNYINQALYLSWCIKNDLVPVENVTSECLEFYNDILLKKYIRKTYGAVVVTYFNMLYRYFKKKQDAISV